MAKVKFTRIEDSTTINDIPITDGQIIVTGDGKFFVDYDTNRINLGGLNENDLIKMVGELERLETSDKANLVNAINSTNVELIIDDSSWALKFANGFMIQGKNGDYGSGVNFSGAANPYYYNADMGDWIVPFKTFFTATFNMRYTLTSAGSNLHTGGPAYINSTYKNPNFTNAGTWRILSPTSGKFYFGVSIIGYGLWKTLEVTTEEVSE